MFGRAAMALALLPALMSPALAAENLQTLQIIVSREKQTLTVYDDGKVIATSRVSTGKVGHTTPTGIFSILEKRKYHESNLYSNAPMPWMQRLTWSGIALHEGKVPNYPASHGCVRLPKEFAKSLFSMTDQGAHVIISDEEVKPVEVRHPLLFQPPADVQILSDVPLRPSTARKNGGAIELAMNNPDRSLLVPKPTPVAKSPEETIPLRILITRRGERELVKDVQSMLTGLGFDAGATDGYAGTMTRNAIAGYKRWKGLPAKGPLISNEMLEKLHISADQKPAPVGQLYIMQGFKEILSMPVDIENSNAELGTHLFTATIVNPETGAANWNVISLRNELSNAARQKFGIVSAEPRTESDANDVLNRIVIPQQLRVQINAMLTEGSSITITDDAISPETAPHGTDFITLTRSSL